MEINESCSVYKKVEKDKKHIILKLQLKWKMIITIFIIN